MYNTLDVSCAMNMRRSGLLHIYHIGNFHSFLQFCGYKPGTQHLSECQCNQMLFYGKITAMKRCCFTDTVWKPVPVVCIGTLERMPADGKTTSRKQGNRKTGKKRHCRSRSVVLRQDHTHSHTVCIVRHTSEADVYE